MTEHEVVSRDEWNAARATLLAREKEHTRLGDELARQRRELPWVRVEKEYSFETDDGTAHAGRALRRPQSSCSSTTSCSARATRPAARPTRRCADGVNGLIPHLNARDVTMLFVSQAPLEKLQAYKRRMGWSFPWVSSADSDFNFDFGFSQHRGADARRSRRCVEAANRRRSSNRTRSRVRHRRRRVPDGGPRLQRLRRWTTAPSTRRYSTTCARARVPDGLLPDPRPGAEGPRRGRRLPALDPPPRRVRADGAAVSRIQAAADRLALVGADPRDDEDLRRARRSWS